MHEKCQWQSNIAWMNDKESRKWKAKNKFNFNLSHYSSFVHSSSRFDGGIQLSFVSSSGRSQRQKKKLISNWKDVESIILLVHFWFHLRIKTRSIESSKSKSNRKFNFWFFVKLFEWQRERCTIFDSITISCLLLLKRKHKFRVRNAYKNNTFVQKKAAHMILSCVLVLRKWKTFCNEKFN